MKKSPNHQISKSPNDPPPLPKFSRLIISIYLFGAPLLLMVADGLHFYHHYLMAVVVFKIALVAFVVSSFGLTYLFPKAAMYFGLVGTGLIALGAITISGISTVTLLQDLLADKGYQFGQIRELKETLSEPSVSRVIYLPSGFAFPLGLVSLAIGIWRTQYTPTYISFVLIFGALFHTVARFLDNISLLLISEVILLIASLLTGWFMWRYKPRPNKS